MILVYLHREKPSREYGFFHTSRETLQLREKWAGVRGHADVAAEIDVQVEPGDFLNKIRGVGGVEVAYSKLFDFVRIGEASLEGFEVEIGEMNYGMQIDGILGFDFIQAANAVVRRLIELGETVPSKKLTEMEWLAICNELGFPVSVSDQSSMETRFVAYEVVVKENVEKKGLDILTAANKLSKWSPKLAEQYQHEALTRGHVDDA